MWEFPEPGVLWAWIRNGGRLDAADSLASIPGYLTPSTWDIFVGVSLTVVGNIVSSWGQMAPKVAAMRRGETSADALMRVEAHMRRPTTRPQANESRSDTILGFFLVALGNAMHILGLWFAPASLLAPANAVGLFANQAFVVLCTNTELTLPVTLAFIGIAAGIVTCSVAAEGAGPLASSVAEYHKLMLSSWSDPAYLFFIFCLMTTAGCLIAAIHNLQERRFDTRFERFIRTPHWQTRKMLEHPEADKIRRLFGQMGEREQALLADQDKQFSQLLSMCVACVAGMVGSQTVCQVKECEAVAKEIMLNPRFLITSPLPVVAVTLLIAEAFGQYYLLLPAYVEGDPITMSALYYTAWTVLGAIGGFVKFKEHQRLGPNEKVAFGIGLGLCTVSILLICYSSLYRLVRRLLDVDQAAVEGAAPEGRRAALMMDLTIPFVPRVLGIGGKWYTPERRLGGQTDDAIQTGGRARQAHRYTEMEMSAQSNRRQQQLFQQQQQQYQGYTLIPGSAPITRSTF